MSDLIRSGFAQEQQVRELQKLNAILQALRNFHKTLANIERDSSASVFEQITTLEKAF